MFSTTMSDPTISPSIHRLAALGTPRHFAKGARVLREGDPGSCLYIVLEGKVRIYVDADEERRYVIGTYGRGALFGEGSLDGGPRTASVEATTDIECSEVSFAVLRQKLESDPQFAMALVMELIGRSRSTARRLKNLALGSVYERFRELAMQEPAGPDGQRHLPPDWSQQEIAQRIGASRDMVTRILRELGKGGYVRSGRGAITVLKELPKRW